MNSCIFTNMHNRGIVILGVLLFFMLFVSMQSMNIPIKKMEWYKSIAQSSSDTVYVINFWATWCIPCVQELPSFDSITAKYNEQKVKVILVSLDWKKNIQKSVLPFLIKKNIKSHVVLLDEPDYNAWVDKVDKRWSGALPATVIMLNKKHFYHFQEKETTFTELDSIVQQFLQTK